MKAELGLKDDSDEESDSISSPPIMLSAHGDSSPVKAKPAEPKPVIPIVAKSQVCVMCRSSVSILFYWPMPAQLLICDWTCLLLLHTY